MNEVRKNHRKFTDKQRKEIVLSILNRPAGMRLNDACMIFGIQNPTYYEWKKKFGITGNVNSIVNTIVPVFGKSTKRKRAKYTVKKRTWEQKVAMVNAIDNRPAGMTKNGMFKRFGLGKGKLYYDTKAEMAQKMISDEKSPETGSTLIPIIESPKLQQYTITMNVEVGSIMELIGFCNEIGSLPKIKTILSVE